MLLKELKVKWKFNLIKSERKTADFTFLISKWLTHLYASLGFWFFFFIVFQTAFPIIKSQHHMATVQHHSDLVVDKVKFLPNYWLRNTYETCSSDMQKANLNSGPFRVVFYAIMWSNSNPMVGMFCKKPKTVTDTPNSRHKSKHQWVELVKPLYCIWRPGTKEQFC